MEKKIMPELSVILVNYNDHLHLQDCLQSIQKEGRQVDLEVILVDNASTDGSQVLVKEFFPRIRLIQNRENYGFSKANNIGFKASTGDFILFLNTDTTLESGTLKTLLDWMRSTSAAGASGPVLFGKDKTFQVSFGKKRGFFSEMALKLILNTIYRRRISRMKTIQEVDWISGACLLVRRKAFEQTQGFDENFFLYYEDIDLCYRIKKDGWKTAVVPQARVFHEGGASTSSLSLKSRYFYRESQIYFYRKHNSKLSQSLLRCFLRVNFCAMWLQTYLKKREDPELGKKFFNLLKKNS